MTIIAKAEALQVVRRAGPDHAECRVGRLPYQIDLDNCLSVSGYTVVHAHMKPLFELGLSPDRLFDALDAAL